MRDIAAYFVNLEGSPDNFNWAYWAWNANSGDTGGIVRDNWADVIFEKVKTPTFFYFQIESLQ